jgi:hypothetical protein
MAPINSSPSHQVVVLKEKVANQEEETSVLQDEHNSASRERIPSLQTVLEEKQNVENDTNIFLGSVEPFGGLKKIDDKSNQLLAIASLLVSFLGVIIRRAYPVI